MISILPVILFAISVSFGLGLVLPIMRLDRLLVFTEEPSLVQVILGLHADGEGGLALLVFLFSVLFPGLKILALFLASFERAQARKARALRLVSLVSKWSMMDVLLVALVIFAAKTSGLAVASSQIGLWFYSGSAIGAALCSVLIRR
ncbi:paraquat-inducible protein A [Coralliovum pocilloporae]|uniref:paraquat-inducible protein A n=1 Tax=Coralliovum pocilloporae TaxID=3066369 RepID=UPI00330777A2